MTYRSARHTAHVWTLHPHQREGVDFLARSGFRAIVADAPGVGKTATALVAMAENTTRLLPALVIAPASVALNWQREAARWLPKARVRIIDDETTPIPRAEIIVCSWALLTSRLAGLVARSFRLVVADEFHNAKSPDAQRTRALALLAARVPHLIGLTGTPIINRESELEALREVFGPMNAVPMIRRLLEDVAPQVPPKTRARFDVALPPDIEREYRLAEADFVSWLDGLRDEWDDEWDDDDSRDDATDTTAEALMKIGYLRRILALGKIPAVVDFAARAVRLGEPVVIFAEHREVIRRVVAGLRKYRLRCVVVDGATSRGARQDAIDTFQGFSVPVFVGSKAAKEGITLTAARHLIFAERWWTSAEEEQAEDRIRRLGQRHPTRIWFPHVAGTVDDRIDDIVETKRHIVRDAIGAPDITETDRGAVRRMLRAWTIGSGGEATRARAEGVMLGYGTTPLARLPSPSDTCSILFDIARWQTARGPFLWARLNGYHPRKVEPAPGGWRIRVHDAGRFQKGTFRSVPLAADIRAIIGARR